VTYSPPSGWVESLSEVGEDVALRFRFHASADCARIRRPDTLRKVDKPYSAPRCPECSPDVGWISHA
jgi:hypothetical protein